MLLISEWTMRDVIDGLLTQPFPVFRAMTVGEGQVIRWLWLLWSDLDSRDICRNSTVCTGPGGLRARKRTRSIFVPAPYRGPLSWSAKVGTFYLDSPPRHQLPEYSSNCELSYRIWLVASHSPSLWVHIQRRYWVHSLRSAADVCIPPNFQSTLRLRRTKERWSSVGEAGRACHLLSQAARALTWRINRTWSRSFRECFLLCGSRQSRCCTGPWGF